LFVLDEADDCSVVDLRRRDNGLLSRYLRDPIPDMSDCVERNLVGGASSAISSRPLFFVARASDILLSLLNRDCIDDVISGFKHSSGAFF